MRPRRRGRRRNPGGPLVDPSRHPVEEDAAMACVVRAVASLSARGVRKPAVGKNRATPSVRTRLARKPSMGAGRWRSRYRRRKPRSAMRRAQRLQVSAERRRPAGSSAGTRRRMSLTIPTGRCEMRRKSRWKGRRRLIAIEGAGETDSRAGDSEKTCQPTGVKCKLIPSAIFIGLASCDQFLRLHKISSFH
uniref:Uncharacterized protein n=1 Tax=Setaria viridis TaxID=4556 RepID=A0A4U6U995_SETVI|nr:hypothetical protein SEVIR_5G026050v2 [Setaria viridis]